MRGILSILERSKCIHKDHQEESVKNKRQIAGFSIIGRQGLEVNLQGSVSPSSPSHLGRNPDQTQIVSLTTMVKGYSFSFELLLVLPSGIIIHCMDGLL